SKCFGKTCHIRLGGRVNGGTGNWEKPRRRADVENGAATSRDHLWQQMTSQRSKRCDVYQRHLTVANRIALRKTTAIAESGVVDQQIDVELFAIKPRQQLAQLRRISQIGVVNVNEKLWMLSVQLIS